MLSTMSRAPPVRPSPRILTSLNCTSGCLKPPTPSVAHPPSATAAIAPTSSFLCIICSPRARLAIGRALIVSLACYPVLQFVPPRKPLGDVFLEAKRSRVIEHRSPKSVRQVLLRDVCLRDAVCVLVPLPISQFLHERGRGVADVKRNRRARRLSSGFESGVERAIRGVGLGCRREIDDHLGEGEISFRRPQHVIRISRRDRDLKRIWIR